MGFPKEEVHLFFERFSPQHMIANLTDQTIKIDVSGLESISIAIASDR